MAEIDTKSDATRWDEAQSVLDHGGSPDALQRLHQRRKWLWLTLFGSLLVVTALALLIALLFGRQLEPDDQATHTPAWENALGLTFAGLGLLVVAFGLVSQVRRGQWGAAWRAPAAVLTRAQRRSLVRQVRGRAPVDPQRIGLARDMARRTLLLPWLLVLNAGVLLGQVGSALLDMSWWRLAFVGVLLVLYVVSGVQILIAIRKARAFLENHPDPATER